MSAFKTFLKSIFLTLTLFWFSVSNASAASFFEEAGDWYNKITNPVSWLTNAAISDSGLLYKVYIDPEYGFVYDKKYPYYFVNEAELYAMQYDPYYEEDSEPLFSLPDYERTSELLPYRVPIDYLTGFLKKSEYDDEHNNFLLHYMTLTNSNSQRNLNIAYRLACYINQYHFFVYENGDWFYLPKYLDAGSVLLYGVGYIFNIPQRALTKIEAVWNDETPGGFGTFMRFVLMIDVITATLAQFLEFFFAFFGTMIGFVIAFFFNPIDSLCSLVGMFYFALPLMWTVVIDSLLAIWGIFF